MSDSYNLSLGPLDPSATDFSLSHKIFFILQNAFLLDLYYPGKIQNLNSGLFITILLKRNKKHTT